MSVFQVGAILFALFMMYVTWIHGKKKTIGINETSFWFSTWLFFIFIAAFPHLLNGISWALHFSRVFDLLIVLALMVITVLVFLGYFAQKELRQKLEVSVRSVAIREVSKETAVARRVRRQPTKRVKKSKNGPRATRRSRVATS